MKKINLFLISFVAIALLSFTGGEFEGKITYEISVEGDEIPPEAMAMFADSELNIFIKGNKTKSETSMGFQTTIAIYDSKTNTTITLLEMMGNKFKIKSDPSKEEKTEAADIKILKETREIAGYKCKKAVITYKDAEGNKQVTTVFYTEEIANRMNADNNKQFKGLKGMPLEYQMQAQRGMTMKMTAKKVSKQKISDDTFEVSSDYKETTMEDLQKEMMKMMQGGG